MSWFRREKPLHERLAEQGGMTTRAEPLDTGPRWGEVGIHGVHRQRRWDAVVTIEAPTLAGDRWSFVALPDGTLLVDEELPAEALTPLADAVETEVPPPYRAEAVRQERSVWAVAARRIEVVALESDLQADEIELSVTGGERTLVVDGLPASGSIRLLEHLGAARFPDYVVRAERLEDGLWEVAISPL